MGLRIGQALGLIRQTANGFILPARIQDGGSGAWQRDPGKEEVKRSRPEDSGPIAPVCPFSLPGQARVSASVRGMAAESNKQFWKRSAKLPGSIQPVYGAQHPPLDPRLTKNFIKERSKINTLSMKNKKASSFHEFARDTSDAWDIGDDEDEDFSSFQTLNSKVAKATAAQVLENHSRLRMKPEWPQAPLSDASINCKVIKSNSEAQLSRGPDTLKQWSPGW